MGYNLIGHQNQWNFLTKAAELNQLPHALLFSGEEQLGKKTFAIEFAKFLNCLSKDKKKKPCNTCQNCLAIEKGIFPDFIFLKADNSARDIQIGQIRELLKKLSFRSYSSNFKIAVLDNAHLMNKAAQNSFLKFLEEPKGEAILILITEYPETLLSTIISRVQQIKFYPVSENKIKNYFLKQGVPEEKANELYLFSSGKPGRALDLYSSPDKLEEEKKLISDLTKISRSELVYRFKYVKSIPDLSLDRLKKILSVWLIYLRSIFISRIVEPKKETNFSNYSLLRIKRAIKNIQDLMLLISLTNVNPKMALENLLIKL